MVVNNLKLKTNMKKLFAFVAVFAMLVIGASTNSYAQEGQTGTTPVEQVAVAQPAAQAAANLQQEAGGGQLHQEVKRLFIEGGAGFMAFVLLCLIFGLAISIERIIYLNLATTNTNKLLEKIEVALQEGGLEAAKEVCRNTRGPVASIFYQGLDRAPEGIDMAEKSVVAYGGVQMGLLEKNLSWIALFIALAPMLGFMGTVVGMIIAFDNIERAGNVSATLVAGGIKVALITTIFGLVVAIILQVFYNYILSKIDGLTNQMEDSSISFMDILVKHNLKNK